ncbi:hypothetical protein [Paracoccus mutanolyticus]|uniref:hypothetical protein n=1 Tax=Paracoccus mutanolyticus TaxID=1499308 RepID=UPI001CB94495|nr:hypothetical protein [Paracoccus mutanolyticus]
MSESSARLMRSRAGGSAGQLIRTGAVQTRLTLETGEEYQGEGRLVSPGIAVSPRPGRCRSGCASTTPTCASCPASSCACR